MKPIRLIFGFLTVGAWTLVSRVLGFARDILIASRLGDGPVAEAFLVAFALPNMFRRFFAEGAFNTAFVPMFSRKLERNDGAEEFARDAFSGLAGVLIVLTLLAQAIMPWLVLAMAAGFADDGRLELATAFSRVCFPYILLISLAALLSGVLNATGRFAAAAAAPVALNVVLIGAMLAAPSFGLSTGWALTWAVPIGGIVQLALVWRAAAKAGFRLVPRRPRLTPDLKRLAVIALPAALAGGSIQINLLVGRQVASFFDGAIVWLSLADRLYQLPLGVVAIAIGVVLLPDLSRKLQAEDEAGSQNAFNRAAEFALLLTVPAAAALVVIPVPLVSVLYERGAFDAEATAATALACAIYGLGLPAFVLQKVLQPLFFARSDTQSPFRYALWVMGVNTVVAVGLAPVIGFSAAAIAASLSGWTMVWLLWRGSRNMGPAAQIDARLRQRVPRILFSTAVMSGVLWFTSQALQPALSDPGWRVLALAGLVTAGLVSYGLCALAVRALTLSDLRTAVRRG